MESGWERLTRIDESSYGKFVYTRFPKYDAIPARSRHDEYTKPCGGCSGWPHKRGIWVGFGDGLGFGFSRYPKRLFGS
ncbi:hypothetical protein HanHA300_Chr16g0610021 [Helianthus annuus]|nr:hypothetical protein HanHA300_Chr16g0610021 [Helianthus annuus]KAJ0460420.1 hypothetical protein HanHA89_Chr16g0660611 [Helianthus annuus]KAJ0640862.1 hypothetical protein HanLR1_Chr16g0620541 [Helianthus annuus]KAJ0644778.1 hypothetical protein HanOQP8_Chr16g0616171 [Helianthus annuus]